MDLAMANAKRWQSMKINPAKAQQVKNVADKILMNKARYQAVSRLTGVPWEVIGVIHYRESACDFNTYLGNGQKLNKKTTIVPKGRGPFETWEDGALDALVNAAPKAALNKDWSVGGTLEIVEKYNGLGYARVGKPSPYVWAGTDQYVAGKYIADHVYDPNHVDTQLGCAAILKQLGWQQSVSIAGTSATVATAGGAATAAWAMNTHWNWIVDHWPALLIGAIVLGVIIDAAVEIYKRNKK